MKKIQNRKLILLLLSAISFSALFTSCTKDFERINDDPNNPSNVPNSFYLSGAQRGIMDNTCDIWWGGNVGNQLAQYWSSNQYTSESRYNFRNETTTISWGSFYTGGLNDEEVTVGGLLELKRIIDNCTNEPTLSSTSGLPANQIAVATILRVWLLQNMTDAWGDLPYTEALDPEKSRAPKYDRQSDIYSGLLSEINSALARIDLGGAGPAGDLIYGGDMSLWSKFGNAVKMRLALRMVDLNSTISNGAFMDAVAAGTFTSNADNALLNYGTSASSSNPVYHNFEIQGRNDYAASNVIMSVMDSGVGHAIRDPRLQCFFAKTEASDSWVGEVYGLSEANAAATTNSSVSQRSALTLAPTLPGIYMDYAQVEFMLAEAAARGWAVIGTAEDHYKAGIQASIEYWTVLNSAATIHLPVVPAATQIEIDSFIAQDSVDYTKQLTLAPASLGADTWKYPIGKQKWIALYNQGIQGWTEWRRLDFGILQLPADGNLEGSGIPLRMKYPVNEQSLNDANYSSAVANQGPDILDTKLWWDAY